MIPRIGKGLSTFFKSPATQYTAGGAGLAGFMDLITHGVGRTPQEYWEGLRNADISRMANTVFNTGLGVGGAAAIRGGQIYPGVGLMALAPAKDLMLQLQRPAHELPGFMDRVGQTSWPERATAAAALAAVPAAYLMYRGMSGRMDEQNRLQARTTDVGHNGMLKVHLPPAAPGMQSSVVELPIDRVNLSKSLVDNIGRDVRRKLRLGTKARTYKRGNEGLETSEPFQPLEVVS